MKKILTMALVLVLLVTGCAQQEQTNNQDTTGSQDDTGLNSDLQESGSLEEDLTALEEDMDLDDLTF